MKVLFYLPLAREWMVENVIEPMIAKLAPLAEVHVMLPSYWLDPCAARVRTHSGASAREVRWHVLDPGGGDRDALDLREPDPRICAAAAAIAPDHCLCRSANASLPARLPGRVRYIMEASAPPFRLHTHWISLQPQIFDHGLMPPLPQEQRAALTALIGPTWHMLEQAQPPDPLWRSRHGLPTDRRIVALPLDYEHRNNLFGIHRSIRTNAALVERLADGIGTDLFLAVTDHPLNVRLVDRQDLMKTLAKRNDTARLLSPVAAGEDVTSALARHADGMIVGDSKSFAAAAFHGTPLLRLSKFASGTWLRAYHDSAAFMSDLADGAAVAADRADAMVWFAYYLSAQAFAPRDAAVTGNEILDRIEGDLGPAHWAEMFARVTHLLRDGADRYAPLREEIA